jgi:hypothetical protein
MIINSREKGICTLKVKILVSYDLDTFNLTVHIEYPMIEECSSYKMSKKAYIITE